MTLAKVNAKIALPFGMGEVAGEWVPGERERDAAWELYVELITRVTGVELRPSEGLLREAMSSLYSLFGTTRAILRHYGPAVAVPSRTSTVAFGHLAVVVLNRGIRPYLSRWHPALEDHEQLRPATTSRLEWERCWEEYPHALSDLRQVGTLLVSLAGILGDVCDAKSLLKLGNRVPGSAGPTGAE